MCLVFQSDFGILLQLSFIGTLWKKGLNYFSLQGCNTHLLRSQLVPNSSEGWNWIHYLRWIMFTMNYGTRTLFAQSDSLEFMGIYGNQHAGMYCSTISSCLILQMRMGKQKHVSYHVICTKLYLITIQNWKQYIVIGFWYSAYLRETRW